MSNEKLKSTPLHPVYSAMDGVKLVDFGGWDMPVQFSDGILAEHRAVRENAGLFDVSHMGEISVAGPEAGTFLDRVLTNRITEAEEGRCLYTLMCFPDGGTVDDLLVYVLENNNYLLVVNASNTDKDFQWISSQLAESGLDVSIENTSATWAQLALQGPESPRILGTLCKGSESSRVTALEYYRHAGTLQVAGVKTLVSRTGYTGEDGYELYCAAGDARNLWEACIDAGALPCGLGARDVLRLEARLPLYGHELSDSITPLEAGLSMFVKLEKDDFVGKEALIKQKEAGIPRRLYGLEMIDSGVAREGYDVFTADGEKKLGKVTSGGKSPVRGSFIALALLSRGSVSIDDEVQIEIRGKRKKARVVKTPFYRRSGR